MIIFFRKQFLNNTLNSQSKTHGTLSIFLAMFYNFTNYIETDFCFEALLKESKKNYKYTKIFMYFLISDTHILDCFSETSSGHFGKHQKQNTG